MAKKLWLLAVCAICAGCASNSEDEDGGRIACTSGGETIYCTSNQLCCDGKCIAESDRNCGSCGNDCTATGNFCSNGVCTCKSTNEMCSETCCSTGCVILTNDPNNCGACGVKVPNDNDAANHLLSSKCDNGSPKLICAAGWLNADGDTSNGCEKQTAARCGNGIIEEGEVCDGGNLGGTTCASIVGPGSEGTLYCSSDCTSFETSFCGPSQNCGNGNIDPGEKCDGMLLNGATCESIVAGSTGALRCSKNCMEYDLALCNVEVPCGNGVIDKGEQCDGRAFGNESCQSMVGAGSVGQLLCTSDCKISTAYCSAPSSCGNGIVNQGEVCDGTNLKSETCESVVGMGSTGTLRCASNCVNFDVSGCTAASACGNGVVEPGEVCDGARLNDKTCATEVGPGSTGTLKCAENCMGYITSSCTASTTCGNGVIDGSELCDGTLLNGATCESEVGPGSVGNVLCGEGCGHYNLSQCSAPKSCGNNKIDAGEVCDGKQLNNATCASVVGKGSQGTLACANNCFAFDTSKCSKPDTCGNGVIDEGEVCDGMTLAGRTCESEVGYQSTGILSCAPNCASLDTSKCSAAKTCGNGKLEADELCDGKLLNNATCASLMGNGSTGTLRCNSSCTAYDTSDCSLPTKCGNGILDAGEACDGRNLAGATCASVVGFGSTGNLLCNVDCTGFDISACSAKNLCGNGVIDAGESCDGNATNGATCASLVGKGSTGIVSCDANCKFVTKDCSAADGCGNGRLDSGETCDGSAFLNNIKTCAAYDSKLYASGNLACASNCSVDTSACKLRCGNGKIDSGEECDGSQLGGATCSSVLKKSAEGKLSCTSSCKLDTSKCEYCGDGVRNQSGANEEDCDGSDILVKSCSDINAAAYSGGTLGCTSACQIDVSKCIKKPYCGDGKINAASEVCDMADFGSATCSNRIGVAAVGSLKCVNNCTTIDDSECMAADPCISGEGRCTTVSSKLQYQLCDDHGVWGGSGLVEACSGNKTACSTISGCYNDAPAIDAGLDWCTFQWFDAGIRQGYGRILPPDTFNVNDIKGYMMCTQDLSVPVAQWTPISAIHNPSCSNCGPNFEYMTASYAAAPAGKSYCTFVFDFDEFGKYICPARGETGGKPIFMKGNTTLVEDQTNVFEI